MRFGRSTLFAFLLASVSTSVLAQDWVAERLRGGVMLFEQGTWVAVERGDVVLDGQKIRTSGDGRVELVRGQERIALAGNTEISIRDAGDQKMTSVMQTLGSVTIEAERRNVQHFSVQTPVLAAVVKGTQFTVTYRDGQARVDVDRGIVQVQDDGHDMVVDVTPGQSAAASRTAPVDVTGRGSDKIVYLIEGSVVPAAARDAVLSGALAATDALAAVKDGAVPNAHAGGRGDGVGAEVRASDGSNGGNGAAVGASVSHGSSSAGGSGSGVSVSVGAGRSDTNSNAVAEGRDTPVSVEVDHGVVAVDVDVDVGKAPSLQVGLGR